MSAARRVTFLPGASAASSPSRPGSQLGSVHLADARAEEPRRRGSPLPGLFFPPELRRASNVLPPDPFPFPLQSASTLRSLRTWWFVFSSTVLSLGILGPQSSSPFRVKKIKKWWCKENQSETKRPRASGPRRTPRAARVRSSVRWDRDSAHPPCRRRSACRLVAWWTLVMLSLSPPSALL